MKQITSVSELRQTITELKKQQKRINFVPTMGYLHAGHQQLIQQARKNCDILLVSIFVNPLQFGANEDLASYPRAIEQDSRLCQQNQVDILFTPTSDELIGRQLPLTEVKVAHLDQYLCGASRPGHFAGVCSIVSKLLNLVQPDQVYFGKKDIQQFRIIQQMVNDLNFPSEIVGVETVRCVDGLALSSRNSYLNLDERQEALIVPQTLHFVATKLQENKLNREQILAQAKQQISQTKSARLDYLEIVDYQNLQPTDNFKQKIIIAVAIFINKTRLIDNQILDNLSLTA